MSERSDEKRRFSDKEMAVILKLAAELERNPATPLAPGHSHSLSEIKQIAAEAGIGSDLVAQAAAALEARDPGEKLLLGGPTTFQFERSVDGEVPENELPVLISTIRRVTGQEGEVSRVLDSVEWIHGKDGEVKTIHVEIIPRREETKIRTVGRYANLAGLTYGGAGLAAISSSVLVANLLQSLPTELGLIAGLWGAAFLAARALWRRISAKAEREMSKLMDELAAQAAESAQLGSAKLDETAP